MAPEQQLEVMRAQLASYDTIWECMQYMHFAFDRDPEYEKPQRDLIRHELLIKFNRKLET